MIMGDGLLRSVLVLLSIFRVQQIAPVWTTKAVADQSSMPMYTGQFLRQLQGASNCRLNNATCRAACTAGVARRRTQVKQTGVNLLSITLHSQVRTAKLCLINSRSVCNKAEFLFDYVTSHDIDIMCITETWLRSEDSASASAITPSGYHLEYAARSNGRGGGVGVLFRSSFHIDHSQLACIILRVPLSPTTMSLSFFYVTSVRCLSTAIVQSEFATFRHLPYRTSRSC